MVPAGYKAKRLLSVNQTTKTTHHPHHVKDSHDRYIRADNCAKECQLSQAKPREIKEKSYKLCKNPTVKARSIATLLFTNVGSRPDSAHKQIMSNCHYTKRGAFN